MSGNLKLTGAVAEIAKKALRDTCGLLDKHRIPYVLEGGTLLGIIRENRLLPWDNDVDITVTDDQLVKINKLKWHLMMMGYEIKLRRAKEDMPHFPIGTVRLVKVRKIKVFSENLGILDIFVKRKVDDKYFWIVGQHEHVLKSVASHFYEKRTRYLFDGYSYQVPEQYEEYLTCRYGNWREPVKDYNFKTDDKSIVR